MRLEVIDFIKNNNNWETLLTEAPYYIKIKRDDKYIMLKYDQIRSDMNLDLVRECRGIIFDETDNYRPVCVPFFKFGNYGESYIPEIDWSSVSVQEKLDGSLIKLWYYNNAWHISSNGEIDAHNAHISSALLKNAEGTDLYTLFMEAWNKTNKNFDDLDENYTYMFELTSPHNRIVVKYSETSIKHIGTRDIRTLYESNIDLGITKPREYSFKTLDECIENANLLGYDEEGYIAVDRNFNRVKIKSPLYVTLNHISQGVTTYSNIVEIIQRNEQDEFLTYFPEFSHAFKTVITGIEEFCSKQSALYADIQSEIYESRKALAEIVTQTNCPACLFALIDGKTSNARDWLLSRPVAKVLALIGVE